jgi:hypothetical protein
MSVYLALRDRRLKGGVPARPRLAIVNTDEHTRLTHAFGAIRRTARDNGRVHSMFVLCHGYAGTNEAAGVCMDAGGMGLELGFETVTHGNVGQWSAIRGSVSNIVVYACAAANTEAGNAGTTADGRYLMGALALVTGAHVYAADRIQWYSRYNNLNNGRYDFGAWEGRLFHFSPNGTPPTTATGAPVELADVMSGTAP